MMFWGEPFQGDLMSKVSHHTRGSLTEKTMTARDVTGFYAIFSGLKKTMTARDVTGFYAIFSGQSSSHFGAISLIDYTENL